MIEDDIERIPYKFDCIFLRKNINKKKLQFTNLSMVSEPSQTCFFSHSTCLKVKVFVSTSETEHVHVGLVPSLSKAL